MKVSKYWKAVVGGLAAGTAALSTALEDGVITAAEGGTAIVAVLGAAGLTWLVPNRNTTTDANRE